MSYILEALRRADAERQRGAVPGLHDQPGGSGSRYTAPQTLRRRALAVAAAGALLGLAVGLGWWLRPAVAPTAMPPAPVAALQQPASPVAVAAPARPAAPVAPGLPTAPVAPKVSATVPGAALQTGTAGQGADRPVPPFAAPLSVRPLPAADRGAVAQGLPAATGSAAARPQPERLPTLAELPEALRGALPALALGGAVYAEQPAARLLIVNGQVLHQGDRVGTDLQLLEIGPRAVVWQLRGQRFVMPL